MLLKRLLWNGSIVFYPHWSFPVADPDIEITGGGGGGGGLWSPKVFFFLALQASVWSKNKGAHPWICH